MSKPKQSTPEATMDEILAIDALNARLEKLDVPLGYHGLPATAATLANALFMLDDVTLELAVKKLRAICRRRAEEFGL
ncbi:hypothetical protein [Microbulbifer sp. TYP-18]|uniref:hypothetical protein n=1 Tax=Microbulbifer sp. TYP-18 TaxID=3230024 RepID=UPI0034C5F499